MGNEAPGVMIVEEPKEAAVTAKPTLAEAAEVLSPKEVELAVKQGSVLEKEKVPEAKKEEVKKTEEKVTEEKQETETEIQDKFKSAFTDPDKQRELLKSLNKNEVTLYFNQKGLYGRMKAATEKRQAAETERDHIAIKAKAQEEKIAKLEEENRTLKTKPVKTKAETKLDIFGNPIAEENDSEENKPITKKDLEDIETKKADAKKKQDEEARDKEVHATKILSILNAQQAEALEKYENFDKELELAVDLMQKGEDLSEIFPDKKQASKARKLIVDFVYASRNADKFQEGDYNAADIAHDMATMHPKYGKTDGGGEGDPKVNGGLDPKKAEKIVDNAGKRNSSASLSTGGGKKFVPYEEMTVEQLAGLSQTDFSKVPKPVRDRILRGA